MATPSNSVHSLGANLAAFVVPPLLLNGAIFGLGWDQHAAPSPYLPPGWIVGTIWMLLFFSMGIARWLLLRSKADRIAQVALLGFLCLIYPLYTFGLCLEGVGLVGSIVTAVVAVWAVLRTLRESRMAAALIGLVVVWLGYASVALARTILAGTSR